jgi:hypothetical protein
MLVNEMVFERTKNGKSVHHGHAMVEYDDAGFAVGAIAKFSFALEAIENLLTVVGDEEFVFDFAVLESALYKDDVIRVVFAEQYPAAMWHIVNV